MTSVDVGVELGGTKVVVAASPAGRRLLHRVRIDTTTPDATLTHIAAAIDSVADGATVASIGIGSFGPLDLRPSHASFGEIVNTPKPGWSGVNVATRLAAGTRVPWAIDTDVNAAVRGEMMLGAWPQDAAIYLTVGTGIGGGAWIRGDVLQGSNHPEMGHVRVPRRVGDDYPGGCPYHADCLEGMAAGPALDARFGARAEALEGTDATAARDIAAWYVAAGIASICAVVPVQLVIIGGGVSHMVGFHESVRTAMADIAGGYPPVPFFEGGPVIAPPVLADDAGVLGAIELGRAARRARERGDRA